MQELFSTYISNLISLDSFNVDSPVEVIRIGLVLLNIIIYLLIKLISVHLNGLYQYTPPTFAGQVLSVLIGGMIAIIANSRMHSQKLEQEERIAHASIKPLLYVEFINSDENKAVILHNYGIGTAILKHINFSKGEIVEHNMMANLFSFDVDIKWTNWWGLSSKSYIQSDKGKVLVRLTRKSLTKQGLDSATIDRIFESWISQLNQIAIKIEYEDILGKEQEPYRRTFKLTNNMGYAKRMQENK